MVRRTPQEKKRLSYERDCRYNYGNSPQAARKSVPWRKALRNRANRHYQNQQLVHLGQKPDQTLVDEVETLIHRRPPKDWKKDPDAPLGEILQRKHERRAELQTEEGRRARKTIYYPIWKDGKCVGHTTTPTEEQLKNLISFDETADS